MLDKGVVRTVNAFNGLTDEELSEVLCCCETLTWHSDAVIFKERDPAKHLYTLVSGGVSLRYKLPYRNGDVEHVIATIAQNGTFGWSSLDPEARYRFSAYCTEDATVTLRCHRYALLEVLERNHTIGYKIMKNLALVAGTRYVALDWPGRHQIRTAVLLCHRNPLAS